MADATDLRVKPVRKAKKYLRRRRPGVCCARRIPGTGGPCTRVGTVQGAHSPQYYYWNPGKLFREIPRTSETFSRCAAINSRGAAVIVVALDPRQVFPDHHLSRIQATQLPAFEVF